MPKRPPANRPGDRRQPARQASGPAEARRPPASGNAPREAVRLRIHGLHAVAAVLANPKRRILRLLLTENAANRIEAAIAARGILAEHVSPRDLDRMLGADTVHQGALVETEPLDEPDLDEVCSRALRDRRPMVVLDQVTDPHNVGAILRSCAVFGATALVVTRRHSPPLEGALAKTASGALELVPVVHVGNLAAALSEIGDSGLARIGLDGEAPFDLETESFTDGVALVLGAEGKGLRRLTRESCDRLVRIGAAGSLASLNVSNAAAVALFAASRGRNSPSVE